MFTSVKYLNEFPNGNNSPAMVNRKTGELYINLDRWKNIEFKHRVFIILHELAHCALDSSDEKAVDELAHQWYIMMGYSLTDSVYALTKVLHADSQINYERSLAQYQRAAHLEKKHNEYSKYGGFDELKNNPYITITAIQDGYDGSIIVEYDQYDFNIANELKQLKGLSRKDYKKMKKSVRLYKRMGRAKKKHAVANDVQAGADARQTYAEQGIYVPTRAESISKGVGTAVQSIAGAFGGGIGNAAQSIADYTSDMAPSAGIAEDYTQTTMAATPPKKKTTNKTGTYVGIGIAAFAVVGIIIYAVKK